MLKKFISVLAVAMFMSVSVTAFAEETTGSRVPSEFAHNNSGAVHYVDGTKISGGYTDQAELNSLRPYFKSLNMNSKVNIDKLTCFGVMKLEIGESVSLHHYAPFGEMAKPYGILPQGVFEMLGDYDSEGNLTVVYSPNPEINDYRCETLNFTAKANGTGVLVFGATPYAYGYYKVIAGTGVNPVKNEFKPSANQNDFLTSQALPLGQASVAGKKVKAFYDVFQYPSKDLQAYIGSYDNPMGPWYGQPEPDIDRLPVKELRDTMNNVGVSRFEDVYEWEPLLGAWMETYSADFEISLLYPWMKGGSVGIGVNYENFKADPTILRYKWRSEPTNTPGAALAKEHDAKWMSYIGAWIYPASFVNIYGEMVDSWSMLIYPNGAVARGGFYKESLEREKKGPGPYEFIPPDVKSASFAKTLLYIQYTDGSWGYIPLPE